MKGALEQHQHDDFAGPAEQGQQHHQGHAPGGRRLQSRGKRALNPRPATESRHQESPRAQHRTVGGYAERRQHQGKGPELHGDSGDEDQDGERQHFGAAFRPGAGIVSGELGLVLPQASGTNQVTAAKSDGGIGQQSLDGGGQHLTERWWRGQSHTPARRFQRQVDGEVEQDGRRHRPGSGWRKANVPGFLVPKHDAQQAQGQTAQDGFQGTCNHA